MRRRIIIFWLCYAVTAFSPVAAWQSALFQSEQGTWVCHPDADGFLLPDFSHAGYHGADLDLPDVPTVKTISPIQGDNTAHIQAAIDSVGTLPLDANGHRGALLLKAGRYPVSGTIYIDYDGVVLRGEGDEEDGSVIYATGDTPHQRDVVVIGNRTKRVWGAAEKAGTRQDITDPVVPTGRDTITVADASAYHAGDEIIIFHPCSSAWLNAVNRGGVPYPDPSAPEEADERWNEGDYPITYHRYIRHIDGNRLTLDAPVFYTLNRSLSQSYCYIPNLNGTYTESAIEDIRIEIESAGGTDENHAWQAVRFRSIENAWAKGCTFVGFGQSGIITEACRRSTFRDCQALDPVGIVTGERMYNFNTYLHTQLCLFQDCYARNGRHHYISNGTSGTSGNVFLHCVSDGVQNANEGHRAWTQGMLYDGHQEVNLCRQFVLGLYNRVAMGTGHGWSAVHSVLWNCDVDEDYGTIGLQKPPTAQNYAIGCHAKKITGKPVSASDFPIGYVEGQNTDGLEPASLYLAQLLQRHNQDTPTAAPETSDFPRVVSLYTMDGTLLAQWTEQNAAQQISLPMHGCYILRYTTPDKTVIKKQIL
ncbi:MAG: T9SS type A sorting domain-containing protein [Paludibacteraceae bacterium]